MLYLVQPTGFQIAVTLPVVTNKPQTLNDTRRLASAATEWR